MAGVEADMLTLLFRLLFGGDQGPMIDPNGGRGG
jgi:hypothetical protein